MNKRLIATLSITAAIIVGGTAYAVATGDNPPSCPPGSHFKVEVHRANGDTSTLTIKRDVRELPPGTEIASNGIVVNREGEVAVRNGEATVECIKP